MTQHDNIEMPWVIFRLMNEDFALSAQYVQEMVAMPPLIDVPQTAESVRGVIKLRNRVIPLIDLRVKMGMKSLMNEVEEMVLLLQQREQDHRNWLQELEASVREQRRFTLTTDPHQCAFGKWYDQFKTDNRMLERVLKRFDHPHKQIHAIAIDVEACVTRGDYDRALEMIQETRNGDLAEMIRLFDEVIKIIQESNKEIALVLNVKEQMVALSLDAVVAVEHIQKTEHDDLTGTTFLEDNRYLIGMGQRIRSGGMVQMMDLFQIIDQ